MDKQSSQKNPMDNREKVHHILVIEDTAATKTVELVLSSYSIGRHSSNDIVLFSSKTSRYHATLLRRTDPNNKQHSYWILDGDLEGNRSRNGILVNDKKCLIHELKNGDAIKFSAEATAKYYVAANLAEIAELETERVFKNASVTIVSEDEDRTTFYQKPHTQLDREAIQYELGRNVRNIELKKSSPREVNSPYERLHPDAKINTYSEQEFTNFAELCSQPIIAIDLYGQIKFLNSAAKQAFPDIDRQKLNHPLLQNLISQCNVKNQVLIREVEIENKVYQQKACYFSGSKLIRSYIADLTQEKAFEAKLSEQRAIYHHATRKISEGIILVDAVTKSIIEANPVCSMLLGYSLEDMLKMTVFDLSFEREKLAESLQKAISERVNSSGSCLLKHQNDSAINVDLRIEAIDRENTKLLCLIIDRAVAEERISADPDRQNLTHKDVFYQQLLTAVANARRSQKMLSIMFLNCGILPEVEKSFNQKSSNYLLSNIEERLRSSLRSGDTVVRWQDRKFAILLSQIEAVSEPAKVCLRIQKSLGQSFRIGNQLINVDNNIGIAIFPQDGAELNALLDSADLALERARKNNDRYQFFDLQANSQTATSLRLEQVLNEAVEREKFELCFQPQVSIRNGNIQGVKAAIAWEQLAAETSDCSLFEIAEQTGLNVNLGKWLIATACLQGKTWQEQKIPPLTLVISLSSVQFQQISLPEAIERILTTAEFDPALLELNITIATLMEDLEYSIQTIERLKKLGVKTSVGNLLGDRYSLAALQQLAFDTIRIEESIIQDLSNKPQNLAVIAALVELGKSFDFNVVVEGVETEAQAELLKDFPSDRLQGFWSSHTMSTSAMTELLSDRIE